MEVFTAFFLGGDSSLAPNLNKRTNSVSTHKYLDNHTAGRRRRLGPLAVDMYLPALPPQIGADFDAGTDQVQLTLSVYLAASPSHNSSAGRWPTALAANPS